MTVYPVSETLIVETVADNPHIIVERTGCSLVIIRPGEVRYLLRALNDTACELVTEVVEAERDDGREGEHWPLILPP
jgi:hypothetical protein